MNVRHRANDCNEIIIALCPAFDDRMKRMVLLSLKLAITQIIHEQKDDYPVLLLDDVFSELDTKRKQNLLNLLSDDIQTVITATDLGELNLPAARTANVLNIERRRIRYDNKQR